MPPFPFSPGDIPTAADLNALPRGHVARVVNTAGSQSPITTLTDLTSMSVTFTAAAGRRYRVTGWVSFNALAVDNFARLRLTDGSNNEIVTAGDQIGATGTAFSIRLEVVHEYDTGSGGSTTLKLRADGSGTGVAARHESIRPSVLTVEDIGAA